MDFALLWLSCAVITAIIAANRGRSVLGWLILGALFGVFALVLIIVLPAVGRADAYTIAALDVPNPATHVKCPDCAEYIRREARVCKHCGCRLTPQ